MDFFVLKIERIRCDIESGRDDNSLSSDLPFECGTCMSTFVPLGDTQGPDLIKGNNIKSCALDQLPASLMRKCYTTQVLVLKWIINQPLATGEMLDELKTAMHLPLLQKANGIVKKI